MAKTMCDRRSGRGRPWIAPGGLALACLIALAGCNSLLETEEDPGVVQGEGGLSLQETLVGAESALKKAADEKVSFAGLFGNEFTSAASGAALREFDARQVTPSEQAGTTGDDRDRSIGGNWFIPLQRLVSVANLGKERVAAGAFPSLPDGSPDSPQFARLAFFEGVGKLWLADMMCTIAFLGTGPELSSLEAYEVAEANLTQAIEAAGVEDDIRQAALVFRARARLVLGNDQGALEDAQEVGPEFEFFVTYSSATIEQMNQLNLHNWDVSDWSVAPEFRGLTIDDTDVPDPRVDVTGPVPGGGFESTTALFVAEKYASNASPIRIASGDEARYIVAEVQGGQTAVEIINEVRARHGIEIEWQPETGSAEEIRDKLIDERFRTLFLEGVALGDLRRYIRKFDLNLFTMGVTPQGLDYTDRTCLPLPQIERDNNPDI